MGLAHAGALKFPSPSMRPLPCPQRPGSHARSTVDFAYVGASSVPAYVQALRSQDPCGRRQASALHWLLYRRPSWRPRRVWLVLRASKTSAVWSAVLLLLPRRRSAQLRPAPRGSSTRTVWGHVPCRTSFSLFSDRAGRRGAPLQRGAMEHLRPTCRAGRACWRGASLRSLQSRAGDERYR